MFEIPKAIYMRILKMKYLNRLKISWEIYLVVTHETLNSVKKILGLGIFDKLQTYV